jgi:hypothetical protein
LACLAIACGGAPEDSATEDAQDQGALTNTSSCTEAKRAPCTPAVGSAVRNQINDALRAYVMHALDLPAADPPAFVYDVLRLELEAQQAPYSSFAYVKAKMVSRADNDVPYKLSGVNAGKAPTIEALLELEGGTIHVLKLAGDADAYEAQCWQLEFTQSPEPGEEAHAVPVDLIPGTRRDCEREHED